MPGSAGGGGQGQGGWKIYNNTERMGEEDVAQLPEHARTSASKNMQMGSVMAENLQKCINGDFACFDGDKEVH